MLGQRLLQCFVAVGGGENVEAVRGVGDLDQLEHLAVVVDDQHPRTFGARRQARAHDPPRVAALTRSISSVTSAGSNGLRSTRETPASVAESRSSRSRTSAITAAPPGARSEIV